MSVDRPDRPDRLVRGPKWRMRTTPARRHRAAAATFAILVVVGGAITWAGVAALAAVGARPSVALLPWIVPTAAVVVWSLLRATPARLSDDDDDTWFGYAIRWALVGEVVRRPAPVRVVIAVVFGAPVGWVLLVVSMLTLLGIM